MTLSRERRPELMDQPDADSGELAKSLHDLARVNRWLGGASTATRLVLDLARNISEQPVTILDVGTGGADIPRKLIREARRVGLAVRILATDLHPATVAMAARATANSPEIAVQRADALDLPFTDAEFHFVTCCTTLHHFDRVEALQALREMDRVARYGVVVTDLARSRAALLGARLLAGTLWRDHPITRHDGPASVRAAFTPAELAELAEAVVGAAGRVRTHPPFRLSLVIDRAATARRT
ncbi:MAG: methyltransferase domain-containing protein [Gemmatimonadota bacterium]